MKVGSFVIRQLCQLHSQHNTPEILKAAHHEDFNPDDFMKEWWLLHRDAVATDACDIDELNRIGDYMRAQLRALNAERALRRAVRMMQKAHSTHDILEIRAKINNLVSEEMSK